MFPRCDPWVTRMDACTDSQPQDAASVNPRRFESCQPPKLPCEWLGDALLMANETTYDRRFRNRCTHYFRSGVVFWHAGREEVDTYRAARRRISTRRNRIGLFCA